MNFFLVAKAASNSRRASLSEWPSRRSTSNVSAARSRSSRVSKASSRATKSANLGTLRRSLAIIALGRGRADAGQAGQRLGVLFLDGHRHFAHRADHGPQRLLDSHAVDRAEQLEEFAFDFAQESDEPRRQAALHGVAFQVLDRVQADVLAHLVLQAAAVELGDQHFVLKRAHGERNHVVADVQQPAGNFGDQGKRSP